MAALCSRIGTDTPRVPYAPGLLIARLTVRFRLGPSRSPVPEGGSCEPERRIPPKTRAGASVWRRRLALPDARPQPPQRHADTVRPRAPLRPGGGRSEEHTSELQSHSE